MTAGECRQTINQSNEMSKNQSSNKKESGGYRMVPLREEFTALGRELAGEVSKLAFTLVLGQMEYWQGKKDKPVYVKEELARGLDGGKGATDCGWFWKSARQLAGELQGFSSHSTVSRVLKRLRKLGVLLQRKNPHRRGDNTFHYRVDMLRLGRMLLARGYELERWTELNAVIQELGPLTGIEHEGVEEDREVLQPATIDTGNPAQSGAETPLQGETGVLQGATRVLQGVAG